jgi:hypothetical protein
MMKADPGLELTREARKPISREQASGPAEQRVRHVGRSSRERTAAVAPDAVFRALLD